MRLLLMACFILIACQVCAQSLDETWTVMVGTQAVQVNADGSFRIPNIPAADQFGPEGPGSRPDFLSDDFLRLTGFSTVEGNTRYVYSDPFQINQGESFAIGQLTFTDEPPPLTNTLRVTVETPALTSLGQTSQLTVVASLPDGKTKDVTTRSQWSIYRTSSTNVATVSRDGLVTAIGRGTAFITVVNEGTTSVSQIDVVPGEALTTVSGFVRRVDGSPVGGILVRLVGVGGTAVTDGLGRYDIPNVATSQGIKGVIAISNTGERLIGVGARLETFPDGVTDGGVITVSTLCEALDGECDDADGDCLPDSVELALGLDPENEDSDGDGNLDGATDLDGDGLDNCTEIFIKTNPNLADSDSDGLSDADEIFLVGTDPSRADSDFDSILDGEEFILGVDGIVTDPLRLDSDRDGWNDEMEITEGSDPNDVDSRPRVWIVWGQPLDLIRPLFVDPTSSELAAGLTVARPIDVSVIRPIFTDPTSSELGTGVTVARPIDVSVIRPVYSDLEAIEFFDALILAQPTIILDSGN